jgi:hypothetical protein
MAKTSGPSWRKLSELKYQAYMSLDLTPGVGNLLGESYWEILSPWRGDASMLNTGVSPREEKESSLSQILEPTPLKKYYLTQTACLGILRRARERGKELPPQLKAALEIQAGVTPPDRPVGMGAYHMNQRDEGIDPGGASGAPTAFAANQRDEVRDLHDVAGALGAQPGMKQQTFIAEGCLTPWDTQQERIFTPESKAPTLAGADGGGGRNPAGLVFAAGFSAGQGAAAGGIGYRPFCSPGPATPRGAPRCRMQPERRRVPQLPKHPQLSGLFSLHFREYGAETPSSIFLYRAGSRSDMPRRRR